MTIELADDLATMLTERATLTGGSPAAVAEEYLRARLSTRPSVAELQRRVPPLTEAEWMTHFRSLGRPIGANLTDEQLSREHIYD